MDGRRACVGCAVAPLPGPLTLSNKFRLPREKRLESDGFKATFDRDQTRAGRFLVMWFRRTEASQGRVGVMATKRILPRAVDRNRAKRLLRETYRLHQHQLVPGVELILLARRSLRGQNVKVADVSREFAYLARKASIWQKETRC